MKLLKKRAIWTNGELGWIKFSCISIGILAGLYFYEYLNDFMSLFFILAVVSTILTVLLWIGKMKNM